MRVKVCGLMREEDVRLACSLGAWAVGLVMAPSSPRRLTLDRARTLRAGVPSGVLAVGVFQDQPRGDVLRAIRELNLSAVQFHGGETPEDCADYPVPVWKALPWPGERTPASYALHVETFLIEPPRPNRAAPPSSQAQQECWEGVFILKGEVAVLLLAGGLTAANIAEAVAAARPDALDVSSGVESAPGIKDPELLKAFFAAAGPLK